MSDIDDDCSKALLYQTAQIRQLERNGIVEQGLSEAALMQRAGESAFTLLKQHYPACRSLSVCCGKGNNGGDGFVLASLAKEAGFQVRCYTLCDIAQVKSGPARAAAERCSALSIPCLALNDQSSFIGSDLIIDALLGIGLSGDIQSPLADIIAHINVSELPVLSLDCPSGLDIDTGNICGISIKADCTITFLANKLGLYTHKGVGVSGEVFVASLGVSQECNSVSPVADVLLGKSMEVLLPRRCRSSHKGKFGHVLVIGGDYGMGGAVRMAAEAALRSGAGLVTVATRPEHVTVVSATRPEIMCHEIVQSEDILPLIDRAKVIVCGPGLGQAEWSQGLFEQVIKSDKPKVMDADCLNLLSQQPVKQQQWILTPHPGEASRLLQTECSEIQADRLGSVQRLQQQYGGVTILKGAGTLVQCPDQRTALCHAGNPGMATAGMGDILSGILGGLLAQGLSLCEAAKVGVWAHATSADCAAVSGGERGMLATDVLKYLREVVNPK